MRVPYAPTVPISSEPLQYAHEPDFSYLDRGMRRVRIGLDELGSKLQEQQGNLQKFQTLSNFSDFETKTNDLLTEAQRNYDPASGVPFSDTADSIVKQQRDEFMKTVPTNLQPEYEYRSNQVVDSNHSDAMNFQYKANDQHFKAGVEDFVQKAQVGVDAQPDSLQLWEDRAKEMIDKSGLSQIDKDTAWASAQQRLQSIGLYDAKHQQALGGGGAVDYETRLTQIESQGGKNITNPKSSASGPYQFTADTARQYGINRDSPLSAQRAAFLQLTANNRALLTHALGRDPTNAELYLAHQQGAQGAINLLSHPNELAVDVVGQKAVELNGGAPGMTAQQFASKWINTFNKTKPDLNNDPRFAGVPLDARQKIDASVAQDLRGDLQNTIPDILTSYENSGSYQGNEPIQQTFETAYPGQGQQHFDMYNQSKQTALAMNGFQQMSAGDISNALETKRQSIPAGPGSTAAQKDYELQVGAAQKILEARAKQPADYVVGKFADVKNAWEGYNSSDPTTANKAIQVTMDKEAQLGIPPTSRLPLPSSVAEQAAGVFKDTTRPVEDRADAVTSTVLMAKDPATQHLMIKQLEKAGMPKGVEASVEAAARGDNGAARRLFAAAVTSPEKYPLTLTADDSKKITAGIEAQLIQPGSKGELNYGLMYGQPENYDRAKTDIELMQSLTRMNMSQGANMSDAISSATQDLFGDVQRVGPQVLPSGQGSFDLMLPSQTAQSLGGFWTKAGNVMSPGLMRLLTPESPLVAGFDKLVPQVHAAVEAQSQNTLKALNVPAAQQGAQTLRQKRYVDSVVQDGVFRSYGPGNKIGFYDTHSNTFVSGADGKPLLFNFSDILGKGATPVQDQPTEPSQ